MKSSKYVSMGRISAVAVIVLCGLSISSCAINNDQVVLSNINNGLNSCIGKLTKDRLIMIASTPTNKMTLDDGEIWVYKYNKAKTNTTYRRGLFEIESESEQQEYPYEIRLRFNKNGVLTEYVSSGYYNVVNHPFKTLNCQGFQSPVTYPADTPAPTKASGGYLGVKFQPMTEDLAAASGLQKVKGAFVLIVMKNSPAEHAGLKSGDVILSFDGKEIDSSTLPLMVAATPIGKTIEISFYRDGKEQNAKVKIDKVN
ncbi:MAG: PDZ domain-containing protein [Syntrophorhabdaceae bacterium]